jgi:TrmH family RNA methyltransferase
MTFVPFVSSFQNQEVKKLKQIINSPAKHDGFVVVEGVKHVSDFLDSRLYRLEKWFFDQSCNRDICESLIARNPETSAVCLSSSLFRSLSDVVANQGVIGLFQRLYDFHDSDSYDSDEGTFVLDNIQDPGNMGTLIRTAVAFGRKEIIIIGGVYPESPKVVRSTAGLLSKIRIYRMSIEYLKDFILTKKKICIGTVANGENIDNFDSSFLRSAFFVLGNEGKGIRSEFNAFLHTSIALPMVPGVDSLNVAVVGGIISFLSWGRSL